jgi:hypothetical protein
MLLAMRANTGVLDCYGVPRPDKRKRGAVALGDRRYRGEAHLLDDGRAKVLRWTPNSVDIEVEPRPVARTLVYNMRHWPGWRSDVGEVVPERGAVAVRLPPGSTRVRLRYVPPGLATGVTLCLLTLLALVLVARRRDTVAD